MVLKISYVVSEVLILRALASSFMVLFHATTSAFQELLANKENPSESANNSFVDNITDMVDAETFI